MEAIGALVQAVVAILLALGTALLGWIGMEIRRVHKRIDNRDEERRRDREEDRAWKSEHQKESVDLHVMVASMKTTQDLHVKNGHRHKNEGDS